MRLFKLISGWTAAICFGILVLSWLIVVTAMLIGVLDPDSKVPTNVGIATAVLIWTLIVSGVCFAIASFRD